MRRRAALARILALRACCASPERKVATDRTVARAASRHNIVAQKTALARLSRIACAAAAWRQHRGMAGGSILSRHLKTARIDALKRVADKERNMARLVFNALLLLLPSDRRQAL